MSTGQHRYVTAAVEQEALGAAAANEVSQLIGAGQAKPLAAWLRHAELAATYGRSSVASKAFIVQLAKLGALRRVVSGSR